MAKKKQRTRDKSSPANSKSAALGPGDTFIFHRDTEDASPPAPAAVTEATSSGTFSRLTNSSKEEQTDLLRRPPDQSLSTRGTGGSGGRTCFGPPSI